FLVSLHAALAVPVLYPHAVKFSAGVAEAFPTSLPPLRADAPTLVVGKVKAGGKLACTVTGTAAGREVRVELADELPAAEFANSFLASMVRQWREAKARPALLRADRSLAFASEQNTLAREDLIAQAEWALEKNELDAAGRLYEQAQQLDPHNADAKAGKHVVR